MLVMFDQLGINFGKLVSKFPCQYSNYASRLSQHLLFTVEGKHDVTVMIEIMVVLISYYPVFETCHCYCTIHLQ